VRQRRGPAQRDGFGDVLAYGVAGGGLGQFGSGALVAPLVGVAGSRDAVPMAIVIAVAGTAALLVDLAFAPRAGAYAGVDTEARPTGSK
jgi:hypothetical protein